jgi:hypothetical protein
MSKLNGLVKQFVEKNNITEMEMGTEEWGEMVMFCSDYEGDDLDEFLELDDYQLPEGDDFEDILEELGVEVW